MKNYGERIRRARKAKKLTMKQLAEAIGTVESNVSMYEREERLPPVDKIEAMAEVLGISPIEITGWDFMATVEDALLSEMSKDISKFKTFSKELRNGLNITVDAQRLLCTVTGETSEIIFETSEQEIKDIIVAIKNNEDEKVGMIILNHWNDAKQKERAKR